MRDTCFLRDRQGSCKASAFSFSRLTLARRFSSSLHFSVTALVFSCLENSSIQSGSSSSARLHLVFLFQFVLSIGSVSPEDCSIEVTKALRLWSRSHVREAHIRLRDLPLAQSERHYSNLKTASYIQFLDINSDSTVSYWLGLYGPVGDSKIPTLPASTQSYKDCMNCSWMS